MGVVYSEVPVLKAEHTGCANVGHVEEPGDGIAPRSGVSHQMNGDDIFQEGVELGLLFLGEKLPRSDLGQSRGCCMNSIRAGQGFHGTVDIPPAEQPGNWSLVHLYYRMEVESRAHHVTFQNCRFLSIWAAYCSELCKPFEVEFRYIMV